MSEICVANEHMMTSFLPLRKYHHALLLLYGYQICCFRSMYIVVADPSLIPVGEQNSTG